MIALGAPPKSHFLVLCCVKYECDTVYVCDVLTHTLTTGVSVEEAKLAFI